MPKQEFVDYLTQGPEHFAFEEKEIDGKTGLMVENRFYQTRTFFTEKAIEENSLEKLISVTHQGKNVEHITRVTGYFSKVGGWNKGKVAELLDRYRTPMA